MAEVLGLVTAIGAILTSGFQVATAISTIVDDLRTAGAQVQAIAVETQTILLTLRSINRHLIRANRVTTEVANTVKDIIMLCRKDIDDIKDCMAPLLGKRAEEMLLKHKLRWLFAKSKVTTSQASLNSLKQTLGLFLQALNLSEQNHIEDYMQAVVRQQISESQNVKKAFMEAERRDQALEKSAEKMPQTIVPTTEDIEEIDRHNSFDGTMIKALHHQSGNGSSDEEGSDLLPSHPPRLDQTNSAIDLIDDMSDDQFMVIADHMRLQKTVSSFALVVINLRQETVPDDAEGDTPTVVQSEEVNSTTASGASQQRGNGAESAPEATENTTAEPEFTVPPSAKVAGTRATFDSSGYDQSAPRAPFEAAADNPMPPKHSYWGMPGYSYPYPGPSDEDYGYSPQHGSYRRSRMPAPSPLGFQRPVHDLEKIRLQEELAFLRSDRARKEEEEKNRQEEKVRQAAEDAIARRMEDEKKAKADIRREQEITALKDAYDRFKAETNARKEAHDKEQAEAKAMKDADAAAAAAKEAEDRLVDEVRNRTEAEIRNKFEEERKAEQETKRRSGLQKLFSWK